MTGINQVPVNPEIGRAFRPLCALFCARPPNIIMIGEIRDLENREYATNASLTGPLFSALCTPTMPFCRRRWIVSAVSRFYCFLRATRSGAKLVRRCATTANNRGNLPRRIARTADRTRAAPRNAGKEAVGCEQCRQSVTRDEWAIEILSSTMRCAHDQQTELDLMLRQRAVNSVCGRCVKMACARSGWPDLCRRSHFPSIGDVS